MALSNCYDWPCWELGWGWTAPFPEALPRPSPPGILWCLDVLDWHSSSAFIPIKLQNYDVHHFPSRIFCPLLQAQVKNEVEKEDFPELWLLADKITLSLFTGRTQSQWLQGNSYPGKQKETPQEVELCHRSCCRVAHNHSDAFYHLIHAGCWAGVTTACPSLTLAHVQASDSKLCSLLKHIHWAHLHQRCSWCPTAAENGWNTSTHHHKNRKKN